MSSFKMSTGMPHDVAASPGKESAQTHECLAHLPRSITDNDTVKLTCTGVLSVSSSWCSVSSVRQIWLRVRAPPVVLGRGVWLCV